MIALLGSIYFVIALFLSGGLVMFAGLVSVAASSPASGTDTRKKLRYATIADNPSPSGRTSSRAAGLTLALIAVLLLIFLHRLDSLPFLASGQVLGTEPILLEAKFGRAPVDTSHFVLFAPRGRQDDSKAAEKAPRMAQVSLPAGPLDAYIPGHQGKIPSDSILLLQPGESRRLAFGADNPGELSDAERKIMIRPDQSAGSAEPLKAGESGLIVVAFKKVGEAWFGKLPGWVSTEMEERDLVVAVAGIAQGGSWCRESSFALHINVDQEEGSQEEGSQVSGLLCEARPKGVDFLQDNLRIRRDSAIELVVRSWSPEVVLQHTGVAWSAAFSHDDTRVVTASSDSTARIWNADGSGEPIVLSHTDQVRSAAFSHDDTRVVTASEDGTARIWNIGGSGEAITLTHGEPVWSAAFSPDGTRVVTASEKGAVRIWNVGGSGEPIVLQRRAPVNNALFGDATVHSAAFSHDGTRVVTASKDTTARIWNAGGSGEPIVLQHRSWVMSAAFSHDDSRVVTASDDTTARIWNADDSGEPIVLRHGEWVRSAAFSHDDSRVVTASADGTARIWNAGGSGNELILRHRSGVMSAAFSHDDSRVVTASWDGTVRIWNLAGSPPPDEAGDLFLFLRVSAPNQGAEPENESEP